MFAESTNIIVRIFATPIERSSFERSLRFLERVENNRPQLACSILDRNFGDSFGLAIASCVF